MKKILIAISVLTLIFILAGCAKGPESVAQKFVSAWEKGNTKEMEKLSTPDSKAMIAMVSMFKVKDVTLGETKVVGDSVATVNVSFSTEDGKKDDFDLNLVKQGGKWLVDIKGK